MTAKRSLVAVLLMGGPLVAEAENPLSTRLPSPEINKDSWVMVEIWPDVSDITLSTYFLDFSYEKNRSLCEATKRVFDRDQEARSKGSGREISSYRLCMSVNDAVSQGYIRAR
jgi:hypothetical protein